MFDDRGSNPSITSRKYLASIVTQRWKTTYYNPHSKWNNYGLKKEEIYNRLVQLGDNPNPDDVDKVIGNSSWTECHCDQCGKYCEQVVVVGEKRDYESSTARLCFECVSNSYKLLEESIHAQDSH